MTGYNIWVAEMAGMALSTQGGQVTVAEMIVLFSTREMKNSRIVRNAIYYMRAVSKYARWMERRPEKWT